MLRLKEAIWLSPQIASKEIRKRVTTPMRIVVYLLEAFGGHVFVSGPNNIKHVTCSGIDKTQHRHGFQTGDHMHSNL